MENVFTREGDDNKAEYRCGDLYEGCIRWKHCSLDLNNRENFLFSNSVYKSFCTNSRYFKYKYILLVNSINSERIRNTPLKDRFDSACKPDRIRSLPNRLELVCSDNPTYHDPARIFPIYPECIIPRIFDFFRFFFPPFFPQCLLSYIYHRFIYIFRSMIEVTNILGLFMKWRSDVALSPTSFDRCAFDGRLMNI